MNRQELIKQQHLIKARIDTNDGGFDIMLDAWRAPLSVSRFIDLIIDDFYVNKIFHRVMPDYIIQGGGHDVLDKHNEANDCLDYPTIENESFNGLSNMAGTIGMARNRLPDSARTQFFINLSDNWQSNANSNKPGYTVFGYISKGMDVASKISKREAHAENPLSEIVIKSVWLDEEFKSSEVFKKYLSLKQEEETEDKNNKEVYVKLLEEGAQAADLISASFGSDSESEEAKQVIEENEQKRIQKTEMQKKANNAAEDMLKKFTQNSEIKVNKPIEYQEI